MSEVDRVCSYHQHGDKGTKESEARYGISFLLGVVYLIPCASSTC
jgi:hypothetical protein